MLGECYVFLGTLRVWHECLGRQEQIASRSGEISVTAMPLGDDAMLDGLYLLDDEITC